METETEVWIEGGSSGEEDSQDENEIGIHDDDQANQVIFILTAGSKRHVVAMKTGPKNLLSSLSDSKQEGEDRVTRKMVQERGIDPQGIPWERLDTTREVKMECHAFCID